MRDKKLFRMIIICAGMLLLFTYGMITVKYKVFPFEQLKSIKEIVSPAPGQTLIENPAPRYSDYHLHKKSFFEQFGGNHYDVVFIGDSIIDNAEWEELFPAVKIANRGIRGDKTDGVLNRMESIYTTSAQRAFIMIGINDLSSGKRV